MLIAVAILGVLVLAYLGLITWQVFGRGAFAIVYSPLVALFTNHWNIKATTIGARCYLATPNTVMEPHDIIHETFHFANQWRVYPYTFLPKYFYQLARYGWAKCPIEIEARTHAGESQP